jgi:hypothetical protein
LRQQKEARPRATIDLAAAGARPPEHPTVRASMSGSGAR